MLNRTEAIATVAVKDLRAAAKFYEGTLGLTKLYSEGDEVITYRSGNSLLNVYRSDFAGTNKATAVTWTVARVWRSSGHRFLSPGSLLITDSMPRTTSA